MKVGSYQSIMQYFLHELEDKVLKTGVQGSKTPMLYDRNTKADTYAALDVKELWLIDEVLENVEVRYQQEQRFSAGVVFAREEKLHSKVLPTIGLEFR